MKRAAALMAVLGVLAIGGCDRPDRAVPSAAAGTASADVPRSAQDLDQAVSEVERLLDDTDRDFSADPPR